MTRIFDAPRRMVFDALHQARTGQAWLLGPPGWTMAGCEIDLRVGGAYRYVWRNAKGKRNGEWAASIERSCRAERLVCYRVVRPGVVPGEALVTTTLVEQGGRTTLTSTMTLCIAMRPRQCSQSGHGARGRRRATTGLKSCWWRPNNARSDREMTDGVNKRRVD